MPSFGPSVKMTSIEVSPIENGTHESFDSSEFSLIPPPLDEEEEKVMANSQYNLGSAFPMQDLSSVEIQTRLVELVEDNESMKEALKYNNVLMKEQLRTISEWHSQMNASLSQQKQSLEEAHSRIQELEKENSELRQQSISISQHENTPCSDSEVDFEIIQAKKFKEEEDVKEQLKESEMKVSELLQLIDRQNAEMSSLRSLCETKEKENVDLKSRCENLELQMKSYQESTGQMQKLDEERVKLLTALQEVDNKFIQEQEALEKERMNHTETKKLLKDLQEKYNRVDKLLQIQSKDQKEKNEQFLSEREQEAKRALEQIDELTAKLFDLEQQLEERDGKIKMLSDRLEMASQESEEIPILKAQLDVYKTDLNNQKEASQKDIQRLTQELSDLQTAVSFCSSCGAGNTHADAAARAKGRRRQGSSRHEATMFICPVCQFGFKEVQALENHVNTCLDKAQ
ncbi:unnamed protein product [Larinioides sclopetarius]|uniref:Optineurin n=1 Tax=Larinioides sclopetarius TaxID=280406 RepID=A0AAV1Z8A2_9ARAC